MIIPRQARDKHRECTQKERERDAFSDSPLFFSWHLFKLTATKHAAIVVASMTHNIMRLSVTILLCLLFAWVFAVFGLLWFEPFHVNEDGWGVREK